MIRPKYNSTRKSGLDFVRDQYGPNPNPTGDGELVSTDGDIQWDTRPYTVDTGTDVTRFKDTIYADEFIANQATVNVAGIGLKSSNYVPFFSSKDGGRLSNIILSEKDNEINQIPRYRNSYQFWDKNSATGQFQPVQDRTLDFYLNPNYDSLDSRNPEKGYQYTFAIVVQAQGDLQVKNWYLRSATGFHNYYVKMYLGVVNDPTGIDPVWQSHRNKDIREGNCFNAAASTISDIIFPLNNTYYQSDQQIYTFIGYSEQQDRFLMVRFVPLRCMLND